MVQVDLPLTTLHNDHAACAFNAPPESTGTSHLSALPPEENAFHTSSARLTVPRETRMRAPGGLKSCRALFSSILGVAV